MSDFEEMEFVIPAYTPDTMPLDRLLDYLQQIGDVVGMPNEMHLVGIKESSTKPVFKMPTPLAIKARERAIAVRTGVGTVRQRAAYNRIRRMVQADGGKPASLTDRTGVILEFPPAPEEVGAISGIRQATTIDGELRKVGGSAEDYIPIQIMDVSGELMSHFSATKSVAKEMGKLLFEPIRVSGIGSWDRAQSGQWKLAKMLIQTFEPLPSDPIEEVLRKLRAAPVVWPEDADVRLSNERESAL